MVAALADGPPINKGSAYVFVEPAGGWASVPAQTEAAKLAASDAASGDFFGTSVGASGDTVVVASSKGSGSVYVFAKPAGGWAGSLTQTQKLGAAPLSGAANTSVALDGRTLVAGAPGYSTPLPSQGAAYVYALAPTATLGAGSTICAGGSATIEAALTGTAPWDILWSDGFLQEDVTASPAQRSVSPAATTVYTIPLVTDANGAQGAGTGSATLTVQALPTASVSGSATIPPAGSALLSVALTGQPSWHLVWSDGFEQDAGSSPATRLVSPGVSTVYTVTTVTDGDTGPFPVEGVTSCTNSGTGSATVTVTAPTPTVVFDGLTNSALGQALVTEVAGQLVVSNIGASGNDGVEMVVDDAAGPPDDRISIVLNQGPDYFPAAGSATLRLGASGTVGGSPQDIGSVTFTGTSLAAGMGPDYSPIGATQVRTDFFRDGLHTGSITTPNGSVAGTVGPDIIRFAVALTEEAGHVNPCVIVGFENDVVFTDASNVPHLVDELHFEPVGATVSVQGLDTVSLRAAAPTTASFTIAEETLALPPPTPVGFFGQSQVPLGHAFLEDGGGGTSLVASNLPSHLLSGEPNGLSVNMDNGVGSPEGVVTLDFNPLDLPTTGAGSVQATATGQAGGQPATLAQVGLAGTDNLFDLSADFAALGATTVRVELYRKGVLQASYENANGVAGNCGPCALVGSTAVRLTRVSTNVELAGNAGPCWIVGFRELIDFTPGAGAIPLASLVNNGTNRWTENGTNNATDYGTNYGTDNGTHNGTNYGTNSGPNNGTNNGFGNGRANGIARSSFAAPPMAANEVRANEVQANDVQAGFLARGEAGLATALPTILGIDEIHIEAVDPTIPFDVFSKLDLTADGMSSFTVKGEAPALAPVTADAGADREICLGSSAVLGGNPPGQGGMPPRSYLWSPATGLSSATVPNPTASPAVTTLYTVTVTAEVGGFASDQVLVTVNPRPVANAGPDKVAAYGQAVSLGGSPTASGGTPGYSYLWSPATGLSSTTVSNPTATLLPAGGSSSQTYTVTVTDAKGCTASDQVVVTAYGFVFVSNGQVKINQNQDSKGDVHAGGKIELGQGAPGVHVGNLQARGNVTIDKKNTIQGNVKSAGSITLASGSVITGTRTPNTTVPTLPLPVLSYSAGGANVTVPSSGTRVLAPGSYGTVKVSSKGTLFLSPGDYFMSSLDTDLSAVLSINASGPVNLYVVGGLDIDQGVQVKLTAGTSGNVLIASKQTNKVQVKTGAIVYGNLIVPGAEVHFDTGSKIKGAVLANSISLDAKVKFYSHTAAGF